MKKRKVSLLKSKIFSLPDKSGVKVSPNGQYLSYLVSRKNKLILFIEDLNNERRGLKTPYEIGNIRHYFWAYDNKHIIYLRDIDGNEEWEALSLNILTRSIVLISFKGSKSRIVGLSKADINHVLIENNRRNGSFFDLYKVNIATGHSILVYKNKSYTGYIVGDNFKIKFFKKILDDGTLRIIRNARGNDIFLEIPYENTSSTQLICFNKDESGIYILDSRYSDTNTLKLVNLQSSIEAVIYNNEMTDISDVLVHPEFKSVQALAYSYKRMTWKFFDRTLEKDFHFLQSIEKGDIKIISRSQDDGIWIIAYIYDNLPVRYYLYNKNSKQADFLFSNNILLEKIKLNKMFPIVINSRDGLSMVSYLTLPNTQYQEAFHQPKTPLPFVLLVHGGPLDRDCWKLDPQHQWLASLGYGVLSVNFRGSIGFGKAFSNAGNGEWGRKMQEDLLDAINWAIKERLADKNKIVIMGTSYGGYASLMGLILNPEVYACAICVSAPTNLMSLIDGFPRHWLPEIGKFYKMIGANPCTQEGKDFLNSISPINYYYKIQSPVFLAHGSNDPRIKVDEVEKMVTLMNKAKIPVTFLKYTDEGHGIKRPLNLIDFYTKVEKFLLDHLGQ